MPDSRLTTLRDRVQPRWSQARAEGVRANLARRGARRRRASVLFVVLSAILAVAVASVLRVQRGRESPRAATAANALTKPATAHETSATPLDSDTDLAADPPGSDREFVLRRGGARFVVAHDANRVFRVHVGSLVVEDMGTIFSIVRLAGDRVEANVEEGRIRVLAGASVTELAEGDRRIFDCGSDAPGASGSSSVQEAPPKSRDPTQARPVSAWHGLAESGDYAGAYESLRKAGQGAVRDETQELLLAADAARWSGHPEGAVPFLEQVLRAHGDDPRVELAAFTLGRVLMEELGRPLQAAAAFERVRAVHGPLAEDALAREVEAWSRAGDTVRARSLALDYQRQYPGGRRSKAVAKFGGLE